MKRFVVLVERVGCQWFAHVGPLNGGPATNPAEALEMLAAAFRNAAQESMVDEVIRLISEGPQERPHKL